MKGNKLSDRAVEFILTRQLGELANLTEVKISESLGVGRRYLSRKFKATQRMTLNRFILREKMHRATSILEDEHEISMKRLSAELGFPGIDHFVMEFENYLAIDPGKYRKLKKRKRA